MSKKISERQKEIIEASGKILMNKGVRGLTTKNLAQEMGFSESAIYRHFKNKEDILVLLINYIFENFQERLTPLFKEEGSATENLRALFQSQYRFFNENPHFIVTIVSEGLMDETEKVYAAFAKIITFKMALVTQIVEQGRINGEFVADAESSDLVHIIMATFRLQIMKWKFLNYNFDLQKEGNQKIETLIQLLSKK